MRSLVLVALSSLTAALCGCAGEHVATSDDAGDVVDASSAMDAGRTLPDAFVMRRDAYVTPRDGGPDGGHDAFTHAPPPDATRPIAPLSGARVSGRRPTLRWVRAADADAVHVEVCADRACTAPLCTIDSTDDHGVPDVDLPAGVVFWRVVPSAGGVLGAPSATWRIVIPHRASSADTSWGTTTDFDADGHADVTLYREEHRIDCPACGAFEVRYGGPSGLGGDTRDRVVRGADRAYSFGWSAASGALEDWAMPDLNGDGFGDFVVVTGIEGTLIRGWWADVFLGESAGLQATPSATILGTLGDVYVDWAAALSAAGDLDGDGYGDVVVGADLVAPTTLASAPYTLIHFGAPGGLVTPPILGLLTLATDPRGPTPMAVGDATGDGTADLVVPQRDGVRVLAGSTTGLAVVPDLVLPTTPGAVPYVGEPGDLDGDGWPDVIAGTPSTLVAFAGSSAGLAASTLRSTTLALDGAAYRSWGGSPGDLDGDGCDDIVIVEQSTILSDGTFFRFEVVRGSPTFFDSTSPHPIALTFALSGSATTPGGPFDQIRFPGDVDGDGLDDVVFVWFGWIVLMSGHASGPILVQTGPMISMFPS